MIEATAFDNALLARLRKVLGENLERRIANLIMTPTEGEAGYIRGVRDALGEAENIAREMNSPQPERK